MKRKSPIEKYKGGLAYDYLRRSELTGERKAPSTRFIRLPTTSTNGNPDQTSTPSGGLENHSRLTIMFWPVGVFLILLCLPIYFSIGTVRLPPYRLLLLVAFLPCFLLCVVSSTTKRSLADLLVLLYVSWATITIFVNQPLPGSLESSGSIIVDTAGSYFLARLLITTPLAFRRICKMLFILVSLMGVFAAVESVTGSNLILKSFGTLFNVFPASNMEPRIGLYRAQGAFEHPILYGVFCSTAFGLCIYALGRSNSQFQLIRKLVTISAATFFSLSTGAYLSLFSQTAFSVWDKLFYLRKNRWKILFLIIVSCYLIVDAFSNRTPVEVFISYLTFDSETSYNRVLIWRYGLEEIYRNPIFGMGIFSDWARPDWMVSSIDNFWLLRTMRHGVPGGLLLVMATAYIIFKLSKTQTVDAEIDACRRGILTTIGGLCIALTTVDLWNSTHCFFWFLLGAGMWIPLSAVEK